MRQLRASIALAAITACLVACSSGRDRGPPIQVINRVLATAPGEAQPSAIVSTEIAYARAAQEEGQIQAGEQFAAPVALMHIRNGAVPFSNIVEILKQTDIATQWEVRTVVMSCDGSLALSQGRFVDQDGKVGNYVTTWARQTDNSYKWTYDVAGLDDPQPPPRPDFEDGDIVVTAIDAVQGLVASCPRQGEGIPASPAIPIGEDGASDAQLSRDGTLRWRWEHQGDGTKFVMAEYYYEGRWITAIEESLASAPE